MWKGIVSFFTGDDLERPTPATIATPDQLIAARIVDSFAREFRDWKLEGKFGTIHDEYGRHRPHELAPKLTNSKKKIEITYDRERFGSYIKVKADSCKINGVSINSEAATKIATSYKELADKAAEAEKVAAAALARQMAEEDKWNLAEKFLGIKRDCLGRISFDQYEEGPATCSCGYGIEPTRRKRNENNCANCSRKEKAKARQAGRE